MDFIRKKRKSEGVILAAREQMLRASQDGYKKLEEKLNDTKSWHLRWRDKNKYQKQVSFDSLELIPKDCKYVVILVKDTWHHAENITIIHSDIRVNTIEPMDFLS